MPFAEAREAAVRSHGRSEGRRLLLQLTPFERHKRLLADHGAHARAARVVAVSLSPCLRSETLRRSISAGCARDHG